MLDWPLQPDHLWIGRKIAAIPAILAMQLDDRRPREHTWTASNKHFAPQARGARAKTSLRTFVREWRAYPVRVTILDLPQSKHGMALIEVMAMHIPHELRDEFPQEISLIERMMRTNYEFRRLAACYDEVNRNIYRIESEEEPTTDEVLERLKKQRLKLKDEIAAILTKLEHRM